MVVATDLPFSKSVPRGDNGRQMSSDALKPQSGGILNHAREWLFAESRPRIFLAET